MPYRLQLQAWVSVTHRLCGSVSLTLSEGSSELLAAAQGDEWGRGEGRGRGRWPAQHVPVLWGAAGVVYVQRCWGGVLLGWQTDSAAWHGGRIPNIPGRLIGPPDKVVGFPL